MDFEFRGNPVQADLSIIRMKAETPTADELKQWDALGGKSVMEKKRAVFIAPTGHSI